MLEVNKDQFDNFIRSGNFLDAATLLLVTEVANDFGAPINTFFLTGICYNALLYASRSSTGEDFASQALDITSGFFCHQKELILAEVELYEDKFHEDKEKEVLSVIDPRSIIGDTFLSLFQMINGPYSKSNPQSSLLPDLMDRTIKQGLGILKMLNLGLYVDAFGSWRTFHESLATIKVLVEGGEGIIEAYIKHIVFSNAFRGSVADIAESDRVFAQMKEEMRSHGLKSKDMKKFIEYGWLYLSPKYNENDPDFKLNFRDGILRSAELREYAEWYEAASELSHSSAIYFYSKSSYFLDLTLYGFYQMLVVFGDIFKEFYKDLLSGVDEKVKRTFQILEEEVRKMESDQERYFSENYFGEENGNS